VNTRKYIDTRVLTALVASSDVLCIGISKAESRLQTMGVAAGS
jgi:hypothetical protein